MAVKPSELSLNLWQNALKHLKKNKIECFLKTLAELRLEQQRQFIKAGKVEGPDSLETYFNDIYARVGINANNVTDFIPQSAYRQCTAISHYVIDKNHHAQMAAHEDDTTTEQSVAFLKVVTMAKILTFFFPPNYALTLNKYELSKKQQKSINMAIDTHAQVVSKTFLNKDQVKTLLDELKVLANRLSNKYEHSWFKFLNKDIKEKFIILTALRASIHKQHSIRANIHKQHGIIGSLTVIQANDLLKQAENSVLAKPRNRLHSLFSKKPTKTVAGIKRCRQALYNIQAQAVIDCVKGAIITDKTTSAMKAMG